jgi:hypothetical protein
MNKFLALILTISLLSGCGSFSQTKPAIVYQTQEVNIPVVVFPNVPEVTPFDSRVKKLTDTSPDGEVAQAYKQDLLTLILRDRIFTDFLTAYRKAKQEHDKIQQAK